VLNFGETDRAKHMIFSIVVGVNNSRVWCVGDRIWSGCGLLGFCYDAISL